jgi:fibronectin type 3 domain-containing protein
MKLFHMRSSLIICILLCSLFLSGCGSATAPSAPTGVNATPGDGQVTISWSPVAGATYYNIYWSTYSVLNPPTSGTLISDVTSSPYIQPGLFNGTTYYYVVVAVNGDGTSAPSREAHATPTSSP